MKRERGFVLPFPVPTWAIYLILAAVALGALWLAYDTVDGRGYARGKSETAVEYVKRDNKALQEALTRVEELQIEVRNREVAHSAELQTIQRKNEKGNADADRQRNADIAAAVAGTVQLRDPGAARRSEAGGGGAEAAPGQSAGQCDAAPRSELSAEAAGFLLSLVHDADAVVRQLESAQDVIRAQLKACNGP